MSNQIISADCHIDLCWLPPELFTENAPANLKDRMPYVTDGKDGPYWTTRKGAYLGLQNGMGSGGRKYEPGVIHRSDRMASTGLYDDGKKGIRRISDPDLRLKDQDRDGVRGEVLYGVLGVAQKMNDPEASTALYRIYNTWLADFCKTHPSRYAGLACVPNHDIAAAEQEVRRVGKLGLKGLELAVSSSIAPLWDPIWEPLWAAAEDCRLPIHFHTTGNPTTLAPVQNEKLAPALRRAAFAVHITGFQLATADFLMSVIYAGVPERHPDLKIVLGESGIGWIPYILDRMDLEWEDQFKDLTLTRKPSEYWFRQMYATYQSDPIGIRLLDLLGEDNIMWGSDFPHPDGVWPDSQEFLKEELGDLPEATRHKIACLNAAKLYGFPLE